MRKILLWAAILLLLAAPVLAEGTADFREGRRMLGDNRQLEAISYFTRALTDDTFLLKEYALFEIAEAYYNKEEHAYAAYEYDEFLKNYPHSVLAPKAELRIGEAYFAAGNYQSVIQALNRFLKEHPEDERVPYAKYLKARAYEKLKDPKTAYQIFNEIDLFYPVSSYAKKARQALRTLAKKHKFALYQAPPGELYKRGAEYLKKKNYDNAEALFIRLAREYPRHKLVVASLELLGRAEYQEGKLEPAIANLEKSLKQAPNARKLYYLGRAYGRRGRYFTALKYMQTILSKYPRSAYADDARYYLALYYELTDSPQSAINSYLGLLNEYPQSSYVDEAIWRAGLLLYQRADFESALKVFSQAQRYRVGEETPKCLFWWGKLSERLGKTAEAAGIYYYLAERFDHTYFSYRARLKLNGLGYSGPAQKLLVSSGLSLAEIKGEEDNDREELEAVMQKWESGNGPEQRGEDLNLRLLKYKALLDLDLIDYALGEARVIIQLTGGISAESAQLSLAKALQQVGEYSLPIRLTEFKVKQAVLSGKPESISLTVWKLAYPKGYFEKIEQYSRNYGLDPYLVLAVIREESRFNPRATSRSRAHGLMQIIPSTGKILAKQLSIVPFRRAKMYEVDTNIMMGTYYLAELIRRFDGNIALALAGYNGGPVRIKKLVNNWYNGDMRNLDLDEFIEFIPMKETRYYVQKVLGSYYEYKRLYE